MKETRDAACNVHISCPLLMIMRLQVGIFRRKEPQGRRYCQFASLEQAYKLNHLGRARIMAGPAYHKVKPIHHRTRHPLSALCVVR